MCNRNASGQICVCTTIPFMKSFEDQYLPKERFEKDLLELLRY
ncbi:hypothetical protein FEDK69T_03880 [Flavobacterium enshiense DK69]|nr:hypothetical protein FEDK69T_03880 [Flavobacterium enshiense DK69]